MSKWFGVKDNPLGELPVMKIAPPTAPAWPGLAWPDKFTILK